MVCVQHAERETKDVENLNNTFKVQQEMQWAEILLPQFLLILSHSEQISLS